jgi:hypothetical protein
VGGTLKRSRRAESSCGILIALKRIANNRKLSDQALIKAGRFAAAGENEAAMPLPLEQVATAYNYLQQWWLYL